MLFALNLGHPGGAKAPRKLKLAPPSHRSPKRPSVPPKPANCYCSAGAEAAICTGWSEDAGSNCPTPSLRPSYCHRSAESRHWRRSSANHRPRLVPPAKQTPLAPPPLSRNGGSPPDTARYRPELAPAPRSRCRTSARESASRWECASGDSRSQRQRGPLGCCRERVLVPSIVIHSTRDLRRATGLGCQA